MMVWVRMVARVVSVTSPLGKTYVHVDGVETSACCGLFLGSSSSGIILRSLLDTTATAHDACACGVKLRHVLSL